MDQRFRWTDRLHAQADFKRVFSLGRRLTLQGVTLRCLHREPSAFSGPRLGVAIGRAYGGAVQRNRLKRILREIFRLNKSQLAKDTDMIFTARSSPRPVRRDTLEPVVFSLWQRCGVWLPQAPA